MRGNARACFNAARAHARPHVLEAGKGPHSQCFTNPTNSVRIVRPVVCHKDEVVPSFHLQIFGCLYELGNKTHCFASVQAHVFHSPQGYLNAAKRDAESALASCAVGEQIGGQVVMIDPTGSAEHFHTETR
jgi:hypothetical protein